MNKLKLADVRPPLSFKSVITSGYYIQDYADNRYNVTLDFDVFLPSVGRNLQRPLCWTDHQKSELILSLLKGIDIGPITVIRYVNDENGATRGNRDEKLKVIDGKQRFSTLIAFYRGEFPVVVNNISYYFKDLDDEMQRIIRLYSPTFKLTYEYYDTRISDQELITYFEMINFAGTPQDIKHLQNLKSNIKA